MRTFVLDTNAILRMVFFPRELTRLGRAIVEMAEDYQAELVLPAMALAEMELEIRRRPRTIKQTFSEFIGAVMERDYLRIEPFGTEQILLLPNLLGIPEMHDRMIAAHALTNDAPLMTSDQTIRSSGLVECVW